MRKRTHVSLNKLDYLRLMGLLRREGFSEACMERFLELPHKAITIPTKHGYGNYTKEKRDVVLRLIGEDGDLLQKLRDLKKEMSYSGSANRAGDHILVTDELVENVGYLAKHYGFVEKIPKEFNVSIATYRNILGRKFKCSHKNIADKIRKAVSQTKEKEENMKKEIQKTIGKKEKEENMKKEIQKTIGKKETSSEELLQQVPKMPVKETTFEEEAKKLDADERRWKKNIGTPEENVQRIMEATPRNEALSCSKDHGANEGMSDEIEEYRHLENSKAEVDDLFREELKPEEVKAKEELEKAMKPGRNLWMPLTFREALYFFDTRRKETNDLDEILEMVKDMARTY